MLAGSWFVMAPLRDRPAAWVALAVAAAAGLGIAAGAQTGAVAVTWLLAPALLAAAVVRPAWGLIAALGLAYASPFAVVPVRLGPRPPILELTLAAAVLAIVARWVKDLGTYSLPGAGWTWAVAGVMVWWVLAVAVGLRFGAGVEQVQYACKLMLTVTAFLLAFALAASGPLVRRAAAVIAVAGAGQSLLATAMLKAEEGALPFFFALESAGYPGAGTALRYLPDQTTLRAVGTLIDPNILGASLAIAVVIAAGLAATASGRARYAWLVVALLILPGLALSLSRGAWLAAAAGLLILIWRHNRRWALLLIGAGAIVAAFAPVEALEHLRSGLLARDESAALRLDEFAEAYRVIAAAPVFGVGFPAEPPAAFFVGVSNSFLWTAEHIGLPGTLLSLALALTASVAGLRNTGHSDLAPVLAAAAVATLVAGLVDHHFASVPHMAILQWSLLGLAAGALRGP